MSAGSGIVRASRCDFQPRDLAAFEQHIQTCGKPHSVKLPPKPWWRRALNYLRRKLSG